MKIRVLPEGLQRKAEVELNENPKRTEEILNSFKDWLEKQRHLKYKDDDQLLINFLRGSKFSLQEAKQKLDAYYTFKSLMPEYTTNLDPCSAKINKILDLGMGYALTTPDNNPSNERIALIRPVNYDPDEIDLTSMMKTCYLAGQLLLNQDDNFVISGVKIILDLKGFHVKTALQLSPSVLRRLVYGFEKALPLRMKGLYVINVPSYVEYVFAVMKKILPKKLAERVYVRSSKNWEVIFEEVPRDVLPEEYGGSGGTLHDIAAKWKKRLEDARDFFLEEDNYHSMEEFREDTDFRYRDMFGTEGSFAKLDID